MIDFVTSLCGSCSCIHFQCQSGVNNGISGPTAMSLLSGNNSGTERCVLMNIRSPNLHTPVCNLGYISWTRLNRHLTGIARMAATTEKFGLAQSLENCAIQTLNDGGGVHNETEG